MIENICSKCNVEFTQGAKFCENCGCNLEIEFIATPICPKCKKNFPSGTAFCNEDGAKLVSPEKMIPKCVKCEKVYTDGTKFCPLDGGKIMPEALRTGIDFDNAKELFNEYIGKSSKSFARLSKKQKYGVIGGFVAIIVLVIVLVVGGSNECIIGTWEGRTGEYRITFHANGTVTQSWGEEEDSLNIGTFVFQRNSITITAGGVSSTMSVRFIGRNTVIFIWRGEQTNEETERLRYRRIN